MEVDIVVGCLDGSEATIAIRSSCGGVIIKRPYVELT